MKKNLFLIFTLAIFLNNYAQQKGGAWYKHYLEGTVSDIQFINNQTGFIASNVDFFSDDKISYLLKTTDGGHTWDPLPGELEYITNIAVINEDIIWVGTVDKGVYKTIDGGLTWHNYNPSSDALFYVDYDLLDASYVYFFDNLNGYIHYRSGNYLMKTIDGGNTWTPVTRGYTNMIGAKIDILSKDLIFDYNYSVSGGQVFLKSVNGGGTWEEISIPTEIDSFDDVLSIHFINENDGFIRENIDRDAFYRTTNGGSTWTRVEVDGASWEDFLFVSKDIVYTFINDTLSKSADGGNSWTSINADLPIYVDDLFYTNDNIYISGKKVNLYHLQNDSLEQLVSLYTAVSYSGTNFKSYLDDENYNSLYYQNFLGDNDGYVYMSFDKDGRGSKITRVNLEQGNSIQGLIAAPSEETYLTYPNPYRATETIDDWEILFDLRYPETRYVFDDVKFLNENEVIAVGQGKIYKSENKGDTWTVIAELDENYYVQKMEIFEDNEVRVLGDTFFHKTTDLGLNWTTVEIPNLYSNTGILRHLYSFNENIIWAFGSLSTAIHSIDGGATWSEVEFSGMSSINDIRFLNEDEGLASYSDDVYYTDDGGNTWTLNSGNNIGTNTSYSSFLSDNQRWLWSSYGTFRYLKNPNTPTIESAFSEQIEENKYSVSVNWSASENVTHYKVELLYIGVFGDEEILNEGVTTNLNHTFPVLDISKIPFLNSADQLKVRVVATNFQNRSLKFFDNLTDVNESGNLSSNIFNTDKNFNFVYPNPVDLVLNINTNENIKESIIYSIDGKKVKTIQTLSSFNVTELPSGFYVIKTITESGQTLSSPFVKK